jgi:Condensation domain
MTEQILVPFEGEDSGVGQLTWGQQDMWRIMQRENTSLSIGGWLPLPPGSTVADVATDLRYLMCRYGALRTRVGYGDDGRPLQVVAKSGEVPLEIVDAGDDDPAHAAAALYGRYRQHVFDYAREWPIRWAVIVSRGAATHLVSVISHLASDGVGVVTLLKDLASRDPVTGQAKGPVTGVQPLELARQQASPAARRQSDAALRYWERLLRDIPARRFADSADRRQPRFWQAYYDSPASHLATLAIAARTGAETSTVLLAAFAVALSQVTGINPVIVQVVVNNRFRRGLTDAVSPICHHNPCVIDVADVTFNDVITRTWRAAVSAYKLGYYDPAGRDELVRRICRERGEEIDLSCFVNDRRMHSRQEPAGLAPTPDDIRAALPRSALTWGYQRDIPGEKCYLHLNDVPGTVNYELLADTRYLSPAGMEAFLRGLEAALVAAALDPAAAAPAAALASEAAR